MYINIYIANKTFFHLPGHDDEEPSHYNNMYEKYFGSVVSESFKRLHTFNWLTVVNCKWRLSIVEVLNLIVPEVIFL